MKQLLAVAIIAVCAATVVAGPAVAAASPPAPVIGVVDTERVQGEYKAMQVLNQQFMEFQRQQESQIIRRQKSRMLLDQEQREYLDLSSPTAAPTSVRDKRLTDLEKLSDDRSKRLLDLGQKKDRTPDEEQEYQKLDAMYKQRTQDLNTLRVDVERTVQGKSDELMKIITDSFSAAVKAVAEEKKLSLVLRREISLYGGTDVTEDVIAKLNQAPMPQVNLTAAPAAPAPAAPTKVGEKSVAPEASAAKGAETFSGTIKEVAVFDHATGKAGELVAATGEATGSDFEAAVILNESPDKRFLIALGTAETLGLVTVTRGAQAPYSLTARANLKAAGWSVELVADHIGGTGNWQAGVYRVSTVRRTK